MKLFMETFEFTYGDFWYKYDSGWIYKCGRYPEQVCPVLREIQDKLQDSSADQRNTVMCAILHGYFYGIGNGKKEKIREFKRVFALD